MNDELKARHQPSYGPLILGAAKRNKLSLRQIAENIGLSDARVRQIINGYRSESGQIIQIRGPAETVAAIASAAGVSAEKMEAYDTAVAEQMWRIEGDIEDKLSGVWADALRRPMISELRKWLESAQYDPQLPPPNGALSLWSVEDLLDAAKEAHTFKVANYRRAIEELINDIPEGGGGDGDAAPTSTVRPLRAEADELSEPDDLIAPAAKHGEIEEPGEFNT